MTTLSIRSVDPYGGGSNSVYAAFAGPDTNEVADIGHPDLTVADLLGTGGGHYGCLLYTSPSPRDS